jgi:hypothetical protein
MKEVNQIAICLIKVKLISRKSAEEREATIL